MQCNTLMPHVCNLHLCPVIPGSLDSIEGNLSPLLVVWVLVGMDLQTEGCSEVNCSSHFQLLRAIMCLGPQQKFTCNLPHSQHYFQHTLACSQSHSSPNTSFFTSLFALIICLFTFPLYTSWFLFYSSTRCSFTLPQDTSLFIESFLSASSLLLQSSLSLLHPLSITPVPLITVLHL